MADSGHKKKIKGKPKPITLNNIIERYTIHDLKRYHQLLNTIERDPLVGTRKRDICNSLTTRLSSPRVAEKIWEGLTELEQEAVAFAYHHQGKFDALAFDALYNIIPEGLLALPYYIQEPELINLLLWDYVLPPEISQALTPIIPPYQPYTLQGQEEMPQQITYLRLVFNEELDALQEEEVPFTALMSALTETSGLHDLRMYLTFAEEDKLTFTKTGYLSSQACTKLHRLLLHGDLILNPGNSLRKSPRLYGLHSFAHTSGLIDPDTHALSPLGHDFLHGESAESLEALLTAFEQWTESGSEDELRRLTFLKGQQHAHLPHPAVRRSKVIEALSWCPEEKWIFAYDFHDALKIWQQSFHMTPEMLSTLSLQHTDDLLEQLMDPEQWLILQGLYANTVIFEVLASIGVVDVVYCEPDMLPSGTSLGDHTLSAGRCLFYFRINPLGAFLLGHKDHYQVSEEELKPLFSINENLTLTLHKTPTPMETQQLAKFSVPIKENEDEKIKAWQLELATALDAFEQGDTAQQISSFITRYHQGDPSTALSQWLTKLHNAQDSISFAGPALIFKITDHALHQCLQDDSAFASLVELLDDQRILTTKKNVPQLKKHLKRHGYFMAFGE